MNAPAKAKRTTGFASMSPERRRELASKGGIASAKKGVSHRFDSESARAAARKRHTA